jgi:putative DNA primase/helicase
MPMVLTQGHAAPENTIVRFKNFLKTLRGVRRVGDEFLALCPAHDDKSPSLAVRQSGNIILLYCHAGCSDEAVRAALGNEVCELFLGGRSSGFRVVAEYEYRDEQGELLYVVERRDPKDFRQRKPDGKGGWNWKLGDVRRVPYRLPEVIACKDLILNCEGEKDCETARGLDLVATTNPGGAGKWRDQYSEFLRGKFVAGIVDADEPGRKHAANYAASLDGKVSALKVLELPGAKDLTDWVEHGGTREQLLELIVSAPEWTPPRPSPSNTNDNDAVDVWIECVSASAIEPTNLTWLWKHRVPLGKLTVFCGPPDVGKSACAIDIIARGTKGQPWPDCENEILPFDVLMLVAEDDLSDTVVPRLMAAGANLNRVHFAKQTIITGRAKGVERRIALDSDIAAIEKLLVRNPNIRLVVVDPLASYLGKAKKNTEEDIRSMLTALKELAERCDVAVLTIDHFNKNIQQASIHRLSGAGALTAVPRAVWGFIKDPADTEKLNRLMLNIKLNIVEERKKTGLKYRFATTQVTIKDKLEAMPVMDWGGATTGDIDDILQVQADPQERRVGKAKKFLEAFLANGARPSTEILTEAGKERISRNAIFEAKREMQVRCFKAKGSWWCELSPQSDTKSPEIELRVPVQVYPWGC